MKFTMEVEGEDANHWDWSTAKCPVCQEKLSRIDTERLDDGYFNRIYVGTWNDPVVYRDDPKFYVTFLPCDCRIRTPPNEFEIKVVPRQDPGMRALVALVKEGVEDEGS